MNLVLLIHSRNLDDIRAFVDAAVSLQQTKAPGAIAVVYQHSLGKEKIESLVAPLLSSFSSAASFPVKLNDMLNDNARSGMLFALFLSQVYSRFPGPWLITDGPGVPKTEDFMQVVAKQHGGLGGTCSGRASLQGPGLVPIGPTVVGLPMTKLSWLTGGPSDGWRVAGRYLFAYSGFKLVPIDEYLFSVPSAVQSVPEGSVEQTPAVIAPVSPELPVEPPVSSPPVFDNTLLDHPGSAVVGVSGDGNTVETAVFSPECASPQVDMTCTDRDTTCAKADTICPNPYGDLDRDGLFELIESRGLDRPHHSTGAPKLIAILTEDDMAREGAAPTT